MRITAGICSVLIFASSAEIFSVISFLAVSIAAVAALVTSAILAALAASIASSFSIMTWDMIISLNG